MIPGAQKLRLVIGLAAILFATIASPHLALAISPLKTAGALEGRVSDDSGKPQMGAVVQLYDRQEKAIQRVLTDDEGLFSFGGLLPDLYSVKVTLGTFLPALRDQILVQGGKSSLLDISLSGLFSSVRVLPAAAGGSGLVNDDWKWVLRSSSATRPVFRYLPVNADGSSSDRTHTSIFADSRGFVGLTAGDPNSGGGAGEFGTTFAFSTSVFGDNQVDAAGTVGYVYGSDSPSAAVRTTFRRGTGADSPEVSVTVRQLYIPRWASSYATGSEPADNLPPLRSISTGFGDRLQLSDALALNYGVQMDSIVLLNHLHYFSPFARLTYSLGDAGDLDLTYTSGNARPDLGAPLVLNADGQMPQDVASLNSAAPVTLRSGRTRVQRGENYEIGYSRKMGSREVRISGYRESVQDAALMLSGAGESAFAGDLVPDLYTDSMLFDAGNYHTMGYTASLTQQLGDDYQLTVAYGSVGVLAPRSERLDVDSADELRSLIRPGQRDAFSTKVTGTIRRTGTHFVASYQIMDDHSATAGHLYSTDSLQPEPGLNFAVRQPVPCMPGLPFHMEATIDVRNLLAEGYLPVVLPDGSQLLLVHTPRSVRGGVNFRF